MAKLEWDKLLCDERLDDCVAPSDKMVSEIMAPVWLDASSREPAERDYDRLRFAAPVRRLADKTQVFPLEQNDSVRTRLTHSEEVSALARSLGTHLAYRFGLTKTVNRAKRAFPSILAAVGLAHDLGNPPFGHQGENAIRSWFSTRQSLLFGSADKNLEPSRDSESYSIGTKAMQEACVKRPELMEDFLHFEGNAQTMRLIMRLQASTNGFGLNLTCGTIASTMKYVGSSDTIDPDGPVATKKVGFLASEAAWISKVQNKVGLPPGIRHPLAHLLEACDDIAYSVIDTEDSVKKRLVSFSDLMAYLTASAPEDEAIGYVVGRSREDHHAARTLKMAPSELNDVSMQKFRVYAINTLVSALMATWGERYHEIMSGQQNDPLLKVGAANKLLKALKNFDKEHAFRHLDVLTLEVDGYNRLQELMSMLWRGITERESYEELDSRRLTPFADLAYRHISENYREAFESPRHDVSGLPIRYRELQLLTDMVSGMTDTYAVYLHRKLCEQHVGASYRKI